MQTRGLAEIVALAGLGLLLGCPSPPAAGETEASTGTTEAPAASTSASSSGVATGVDTSTGAVDSGTAHASTTHASTSTDDGSTTTGSGDASGSESTTGGNAGLGVISGDCGLIDAMELDASAPFTFAGAIDFRELGFDYDMLTPGGQEVFDDGNLGGSSLESEVVSFEVLARCEGATLLATEAEIQYTDPMGIKTDLLVEIDGRVVGVSVTRAVGFPFEDPYTELQATELLTGKLEDILASTANVAPRDAWVKQILHVIAYADMHAQSILAAHAALPPAITADTVLVVTVTHGNDAFVY